MRKNLFTKNTKKCKKRDTQKAFALLEVVFAVLVVGAAFGILARFYFAKTQTQELAQNIAQIEQDRQQNEEQILAELQSHILPKSHKIIGANGEFCEGKMFESVKKDFSFKMFKPQNCEQ